MTDININVELGDSVAQFNETSEDVDEAGTEIVDQLSVLAERFMKKEAPVGVGLPSEHMRDTITTQKSQGGHHAVIKPHKRTEEGWLLHKAIVGNPSTPSYGDEPPPVWSDGSGNAQGPLAEWAAAKLGDASDAWKIQNTIQEEGQRTFPNRFIDRSVNTWSSQVKSISQKTVRSNIE